MEIGRFVEALKRAGPKGRGIEQWSLYATERRGLSLGIKDGEAGNAHAPLNIAEGCGARYLIVWSDGLVSRGSLERRQLEHEIEEALEQARSGAYEDPDAAHVLGPAPIPEVRLHGPGAAAVAHGDVSGMARRLDSVRRRVAENEFRTWSGSFSAGEGDARLITSAGLDVSGRGTSAGWYVSFEGEIGDGFGAREIDEDSEFEARLDRLVETARQLKQSAGPMNGGVRPVLLHPHVVEQYVLGTLMHNLQGSVVSNEEGHFRAEQFGSPEPILREDLTLRVDPLQPLKSGAYRFTVEGVPASRCSFIECGRLIEPILDVKYARRLGRSPTAAPFAMDTLHFEGRPPLTLAEGLSAASGGALILSVLGVHTQDASSGDFSLSAPQALRIEEQGYAGRIRCTISGNLFALLRSDGSRLVRFEGEHSPGLLVDCRLDPK